MGTHTHHSANSAKTMMKLIGTALSPLKQQVIYFTAALNIRADIYHERFTDENMIFNKNFKHNTKQLIKFFLKTECLSRKPELTKADLSPKRPNKGKKRKKDLLHNNVNNQAKQTKLTQFLNKKIT